MVEAFTWFIFEIISIMTYKNGVISQKMLNKNDECFYCFNFYSGHTQNFILFNLLKKSRKSVDAYWSYDHFCENSRFFLNFLRQSCAKLLGQKCAFMHPRTPFQCWYCQICTGVCLYIPCWLQHCLGGGGGWCAKPYDWTFRIGTKSVYFQFRTHLTFNITKCPNKFRARLSEKF